MSCPHPVSDSALFLETTQYCFNQSGNHTRHTYIKFGDLTVSDVTVNCSIDLMAMSSFTVKDENNVSLSEIHSALLYGFELEFSWPSDLYRQTHYACWLPNYITSPICGCDQLPSGCNNRLRMFVSVCDWILLILSIGAVFAVAPNLALRILIGIPCMLALLIYKLHRRRHSSMFDVIEGFL
ncbi:hypothetical protein CDL12_12601 [Handroanthus impetiginosus]|uniref:Uncharacterized protein n=1 Tax=Handroanthus impetiginosus TaxID=429701 RepID=A0A2G9HB95_9LAMI|nr:hypothetical protein CDL12_12601 [Handroanthus impetiginosus]